MSTSGEPWTEARLQRYIDEQIQEDLQLDYKGAGSLDVSPDKRDKTKRELLKDVSAMANSAGGVIVYGILEYQDKERRHLPERFDPVDQSVATRELIEQVINRVRPRLQGVVITPVPVGTEPNMVAYVVEVPQGATAHQHPDERCYYKRFNTTTEKMEDYEIRDVMNRSSQAQIDLVLELERQHWNIAELSPFDGERTAMSRRLVTELKVYAENSGAVYAQYVVGSLYLPRALLDSPGDYLDAGDGVARITVYNNREDTIGLRTTTRDVPVLPGTREEIAEITLSWAELNTHDGETVLRWEVSADNARKREGSVHLCDLLASVQVTDIDASEMVNVTTVERKRIRRETPS